MSINNTISSIQTSFETQLYKTFFAAFSPKPRRINRALPYSPTIRNLGTFSPTQTLPLQAMARNTNGARPLEHQNTLKTNMLKAIM